MPNRPQTLLPPPAKRHNLTLSYAPRTEAPAPVPTGLSPLELARLETLAAVQAAARDSRKTLPARPGARTTRMPAVTLEQLCAEARGSL